MPTKRGAELVSAGLRGIINDTDNRIAVISHSSDTYCKAYSPTIAHSNDHDSPVCY